MTSEPAPERVRTPEFPRNFDSTEFFHGAFFAWVAFQPIGIGLLAVSGRYWAPAASGGPLSLIAAASYFWALGGVLATVFITLLGMPLAYGLGRMLRRVRRDGIHVGVFFVYGASLGYLMMWLLDLPERSDPSVFGLWSPPGAGIGAGTAVALGWLISSRRALAADRKHHVSR